MSKFHGTLEDLQSIVEECNLVGDWKSEGKGKESKHSFKWREGANLDWWPSTGTIRVQGKNKDKDALEKIVFPHIEGAMSAATETGTPSKTPGTPDKQIFIVHGHDTNTLDHLELALRRLGLEPFILQNSSSSGSTIIEALEKKLYNETDFGIILLTPDDFGYSEAAGEGATQPRARQNAILEMGMVMAAVGRDRMVILKKGVLEMPSDIENVIRLEFNDHIRKIVPALAEKLREAGFEIDTSKIAAASR